MRWVHAILVSVVDIYPVAVGAVGTVENSGLSEAREEFSKRCGNGGKTS
jgi:hypothetical protein